MFELRPYQKEAVKCSLDHFSKSCDPALIVLPTGAGKSIVIAEISRLVTYRVLIITHVKELVEQNHQKFESYGIKAGIYSAGLERKESEDRVIFSSIQSIANAEDSFFEDFELVVIDECHRISLDKDSQYQKVLKKIKDYNPSLSTLGLTATPYRLGLGWIYNIHYKGYLRTVEDRYFKKCIYELPLTFMIKNNYLTVPILIDSPVACYDFSSIKVNKQSGLYNLNDIKGILKDQKRITPGIIKNILDQSVGRRGVMIFTSAIKHAYEILEYLPKDLCAIITGETHRKERESVISNFKEQKIKFLVNVSVLTTGFDAPHVDLIAILRPTESVSLYQQIIGRGLRLYPGKKDCLVLDYTGVGMNIYSPEIGEDKPSDGTMPVKVECPKCGLYNDFWGVMDEEGNVLEHFGRKCKRGEFFHGKFIPCGYLYRFKECSECGADNDIAARECRDCKGILVDPDNKLKEAMALKDAHVLRLDHIEYVSDKDKKGRDRISINYYDVDAEHITESYLLDTYEQRLAFYHNFVRYHLRNPAQEFSVNNSMDIVSKQALFRKPSFVIARKIRNYWVVREKIFN